MLWQHTFCPVERVSGSALEEVSLRVRRKFFRMVGICHIKMRGNRIPSRGNDVYKDLEVGNKMS